MRGFKFVETLKISFEKQSGDEIIHKTAYFNSSVQTIINHIEIKLSKQEILNKIAQKAQGGLLNLLTIIT